MAHLCAISLFIFSLSRKKERKQNQERDKRLLAVTIGYGCHLMRGVLRLKGEVVSVA